MNKDLRVLIVEDSAADAELIIHKLYEAGVQLVYELVDTADDTRRALGEKQWDVILCDYSMPNFDPYKVLDILRETELEIPFIVISGKIGEDNAVKLLRAGCHDCIMKSDLRRLPDVINREINEAIVREENRILNKKLQKYQILVNEEKDKRAEELVVANKELAFQNEEKDKKAAELKEIHLSLIKSEERYKVLTQTSIDGFFILDIEGRVLEVNDVYCKISGYSRETLLSMNIKDLELDEVDKQIDEHIEKIIDKGSDQFESRQRKSDGTFFHVHNSITFIPNEKLFICFFHDITDRKKAEKDLLYMIYHDYLTGLYNRRYFEEAFKKLDTKTNLPISIIMCDINGLKLINDSFGHGSGDGLLRKAAETIKKACRAGDVVSRLGGDEFVIILPKTDAEETVQIANQIKEFASKVKVDKIELSISYGYDTKRTDEQSMIEIFATAENHMYRHKLYERSSMRSQTIDLIMKTLFEKSNRESLHSDRVSSICQAIASKMNFNKGNVDKMRIAGLVHDIGKIGIDDKILNKDGSLSSDERHEIERHPEIGWRILSTTNEFLELAQFVLDHHERWDGGGYPNGLKGEKIPLESRIITVADAYDAMTSGRSYRKGLDNEEAIKEMKRCSGTQFDPEIVDVFVNQVLPSNSNFGEM
jgi:diguanylate cyclase (GGDEF)-like protein/PAS domain S-box-containing protein